MTPDIAGHGQGFGFIVTIVVVLAIVLLRNRQARKLRIEMLWVRPVIFLALLVSSMVAAPPALTPISISLMVGALAIGGALGWQRGRFIRIEVDPETHALTSRASPIGMLFILALVGVRMGLRGLLLQNAAALQLSALAATNALLVLVVAMMVVQSIEMWLRARRLLNEAQAAKAGLSRAPTNSPIVR